MNYIQVKGPHIRNRKNKSHQVDGRPTYYPNDENSVSKNSILAQPSVQDESELS